MRKKWLFTFRVNTKGFSCIIDKFTSILLQKKTIFTSVKTEVNGRSFTLNNKDLLEVFVRHQIKYKFIKLTFQNK